MGLNDGAISGCRADIDKLSMTTATDPATNAATTATIIGGFAGVIITTTTTGNSQTLSDPTDTTAGKVFSVVVDEDSTNSIAVVANATTYTIPVGKSQSFIWDGAEWGSYDMGITSLPVPYNQGGTGVTDDLANYHIWVDGSRSDTYTADGSMARPYKTVLAALTVINADTGKSWVMNVASGTYSDNLTITGPRYLSIRGQGGVTLSGTILINSGVGSYDRIEFIGVHGLRAEKGPAMTISGKMTCTRADDSLIYLSFYGCLVSGELECTTLGTWVVQYEKCRVTGAITGTFTRAAHEQLLLECYGFNEFVGAITGWVSFYNCHDSDFYSNITTTPYYESRFTHCSFAGSVSIIPVVGASSALIYTDTISLKALIDRTPTLTGATITYLDKVANGTYKGIIDIAAPGELGSTTPNKATFTDTYLYGADVAHGITSITATTNYGADFYITSANGGRDIYGITDADQAGALRLTGIIGATDPTDSNPATVIRGGKKNGTGWQALGAAETVVEFFNYTTSVGKIYGNGEFLFTSLQNTPIGSTIASTGIFTTVDAKTDITIKGTTGGLVRKFYEATANISAAASVTITLSIPTNAVILGCQLRVDAALATGELWDAAYSGGSTEAIATAQAVAQNTKVNSFVTDITDNTTNIAITKNGGGSFTAQGTIRAIVYTEEFDAMASL